jgi:hypothetical protein
MTSRFAQKRFVTPELEQQLRCNRVIVPSRPDPWFGRWAPGSTLTEEQLHQLAQRGLDPDTERLDVHVSVSQAQLWMPLGEKQPWRLVPCPIVGRMKDGRLKVVAPNGERKLVYATGELRKPWHWPGEKARIAARENIGDMPV